MASRWLGAALLGAALGLTLATPVAQAQIAAPMLSPSTFSSENPAAIKWGAPSRFGFGVATAKKVDQPGNTNTDYTGADVGFRAVGERFAFGIEQKHLADQEASIKDVSDLGSASLALQTGDSLAWGVGYNTDKQVTDTTDADIKEPVFGVSLRLAEIWFFGAAIGRESEKYKDTSGTPFTLSADRQTTRYGVGFRRGGSVLVHIEAFGGHKNELRDGVISFGSEDFTGGTLEFALGPVFIGGSTKRITYSQQGRDYTNVTTGDIGYVPRQGFALTLHYEGTYTKFDFASTSMDYTKTEISSLQFTWLF